MIGARLFIELGMEPATATRQVRAVRPGQSRRRIKKTTSSGAAITSSTVTLELSYQGDPETGEPLDDAQAGAWRLSQTMRSPSFAHEHHIWDVDNVKSWPPINET
jgi:hypothetical protein